jgi:hypothetical protein
LTSAAEYNFLEADKRRLEEKGADNGEDERHHDVAGEKVNLKNI